MPHPKSRLPSPEPFVVRTYRLGLRLYPASYRERFGPEMQQVFRDQWHAAQSSGSSSASLTLLLRTFADLLCTSVRERLVACREALNLNVPRPGSPSARLAWSLGAGLLVTTAVVGLAMALTLAMPRTYQSDARVLVRYRVPTPADTSTASSGPTVIAQELERATSPEVLARVMEKLSLNERWSGKYLRTGKFQTPETVEILRDHVLVTTARNAPVVRISAMDEDRQLASDIANAWAEAYVALQRPTASPSLPGDVPSPNASIIDLAEPGLKPTRPNLPLNLLLGIAAGGLLGLIPASAVWFLLRRRSSPRPTTAPA